jgi:hypothetical protein
MLTRQAFYYLSHSARLLFFFFFVTGADTVMKTYNEEHKESQTTACFPQSEVNEQCQRPHYASYHLPYTLSAIACLTHTSVSKEGTVIPIMQCGKLRSREATWLARGLKAGDSERQSLNLRCLTSRALWISCWTPEEERMNTFDTCRGRSYLGLEWWAAEGSSREGNKPWLKDHRPSDLPSMSAWENELLRG